MGSEQHWRCYVPADLWREDEAILTGAEFHHLVRVLRARVGAEVAVFDGQGGSGIARIEHIGRASARLRRLQYTLHPPPSFRLEVFLPVLREVAMDWILQKATELGVSRIAPLWTTRGVVRPPASELRLRRWESIILNAARQCGAVWIPQVQEPASLDQAMADAPEWFVVAALQPGAPTLREHLKSRPLSDRAGVAVGPEGDWTDEEIKLLQAAGAVPVSLGDRVLRVETAVLFLVSAIVFERMI